MKGLCGWGPTGLAEVGLEPRGLKSGGLWDRPMPEALEKPFSQPPDNRNWVSCVSREGDWRHQTNQSACSDFYSAWFKIRRSLC